MMKEPLKNPFSFAGETIAGKWHKNRYVLKKPLGRGANGVVFLAAALGSGREVAVKMSGDNGTIISEVNVLKSLAKARGSILGPSLLDVDDWVRDGETVPFYVMEYIRGTHFLTFLKQRGYAWLPVLMIQLLTHLEGLHQNGWVFGDLKPDNLIVTDSPVKLRCIDVGGTTMQGRAIKEFTEFFDRGYWGLGNRKAEPAYDLFSVAMIIINAYYPERFPKREGGLGQLKKAIRDKEGLRRYESPLIRALTGQYAAAGEMKRDLYALYGQERRPGERRRSQGANPAKTGDGKKGRMWETVIVVLLILGVYALYIFQQIQP
ncbi:MAG: serine/threonine protein kinase [Caldibacillus debilis]|uniref:Serine/threonine protein kinase n=1 Tax=Caldibacillus debilis TaxID=301148 RepID=A0A3E0K7X4_9BACI|nr:protein kinase [Caldibacillus debilis]REJ31329.1 MAG: serine/threonine protein kinase [Caldibacillus debilis]